MTESDFCDLLEGLLVEAEDAARDEPAAAEWPELANGIRVRSFADAGLMTRNVGLVVTLFGKDGAEFQVTVVRSK